jgi:hypothetical protein
VIDGFLRKKEARFLKSLSEDGELHALIDRWTTPARPLWTEPPPEPRLGARLELELVDLPRDRKRYYSLAVCADTQLALPGIAVPPALLLVVAHGRIGKRLIVARKRFLELEELAREWRKLLRQRELHGYVITSGAEATRAPPR